MYLKVIQDKVETMYEVTEVSYWKSSSGVENSTGTILCIDMELPNREFRLNIDIEGEAQVYLLNNSGKTIERIL